MKKIVFGLLLLIAGVLFLTNYLTKIAMDSTDKVSVNALSKLIATGNKTDENIPPVETKPTVVQQINNTVTPLVKQATDTVNNNLPTAKSPIATIKIYDKKTAKEITIETSAQLEAQHQQLSAQQLDEQKDKSIKFQAYYQKPERCVSPSSHEMHIQCGNEYMRAKTQFEELYQQGKFKNLSPKETGK